jgi:hypothetical protein
MTLALKHGRRIATPIHPGSLSAIDRFGKYKKEDPAVLRQAEVGGSALGELRRRREMLRGMSPEEAISHIEFHKGLTVFQALALAKEEGKLIVPNSVYDRILTETAVEGFLERNHPYWTGTMVIYSSRGTPFGEKIVYHGKDFNRHFSVSFDVPPRFRDKVDCALVIEHPDFDLVPSGENAHVLIADEDQLYLLERFPGRSGNYGYDERYRLPSGGNSVKDYRSLGRMWDNFINLVARGSEVTHFNNNDLLIALELMPSNFFRVALF